MLRQRNGRKGEQVVATERIEVSLKYEGANVENGTMAISDVIPVLQGFSGAFTRIANMEKSDIEHRITLTAVRSGSVEFVLDVISHVADNPELIAAAMETLRHPAAFRVVETMFGVIQLKRHVGWGKRELNIFGDSIEVKNSDNATINVTKQVFVIEENGTINRWMISRSLWLMKG